MPDVVYCPQVDMQRSIDGGKTFQTMKGFSHGDHHDWWIDPTNPQRMITAHDGGVDISTDGGKTWRCPAAADLPVLPHRLRQLGPVPRARLHAGHGHRVRAEQFARHAKASCSATGTPSAAARPATRSPTRPTRTSSMPANTAATSRATTTARGRPGTSASTPTTRPATAPRT